MKNYLAAVVAAGLVTGALSAIDLDRAAHADTLTTGSIRGVVKDKTSGEAGVGATVAKGAPVGPYRSATVSSVCPLMTWGTAVGCELMTGFALIARVLHVGRSIAQGYHKSERCSKIGMEHAPPSAPEEEKT